MGRRVESNRRRFIVGTITAGAGLVLASCRGEGDTEEEVSPAEDLMREHGILKRVLMVYDESARRLDEDAALPADALAEAASIIRSFIEDYHEKLEEDFLFPRYRKANALVDLVDVLEAQHKAGRALTDTTMGLATAEAMQSADDRRRLAESLRAFVRMYAPHEAREDTVLFPALHKIVTPHEYGSLGEDFEKRERELFGEEGFEKMVDRVAGIEKRLGIYDLSQFTPQAVRNRRSLQRELPVTLEEAVHPADRLTAPEVLKAARSLRLETRSD